MYTNRKRRSPVVPTYRLHDVVCKRYQKLYQKPSGNNKQFQQDDRMQSQLANNQSFLYTNNKHKEKDLLETLQCTIAQNENKISENKHNQECKGPL